MNQPHRPSEAFAPHLRVRGLTIRRGERLLFEDLAFEVRAGGVLLVRGPNGVGKSTLLMALAGIVRPDAGTIEGVERTRLHLLNYRSGLKPRLTVAENLKFWRAMHGATGLDEDAALEVVGIDGLGGLEAGYLSSGQLRRLALARLLVSKRPVWLLDEPSAALDAEGEALLGRLIDAHRASGGIAIVATHHDLMLADAAGVETLMLGGGA
ncbi:heme ABC exporter ATP-binding protein CcmA [Devosia sp.]|uniref:heme ABC exporter ATP-binding protein CcmA n=1 Tax=Devosia sp. TaxID=1871048 RepID=UPI00262A0122|nr:heme ABC exporter ATP-binding protein CcmA [Devosia sp.]